MAIDVICWGNGPVSLTLGGGRPGSFTRTQPAGRKLTGPDLPLIILGGRKTGIRPGLCAASFSGFGFSSLEIFLVEDLLALSSHCLVFLFSVFGFGPGQLGLNGIYVSLLSILPA